MDRLFATRGNAFAVASRAVGGLVAFVALRWVLERKPLTADPIELAIVVVIAAVVTMGRAGRASSP